MAGAATFRVQQLDVTRSWGPGLGFGPGAGLLLLFWGRCPHEGPRLVLALGQNRGSPQPPDLISGLDAHPSWEGHTGGWAQAVTPNLQGHRVSLRGSPGREERRVCLA